jgi:hypothetical protein
MRSALTASPAGEPASGTFSAPEWRALAALHARFQEGHDLFSERELAHLRFLRWLREEGRLAD